MKLLVANRGEIAVRVIRTALELGIPTVAVYSTADANSLAVEMADEAVCIGPPAARDSYLDVRNVIGAAEVTGCDAVHPGYGFLSENPDFATECANNGIRFVGPAPEVMARMGDKIRAKEAATEAGLPVLGGSEGGVTDVAAARGAAEAAGFPILLKASAGGGGRGMRRVDSADELERAFENASQEALAAFGDGSLYVEKLLEGARHVEVQVLGDANGCVLHLGDRDCSLQRNHQKLIEEAPAPDIPDALRSAMYDAAVRLARGIGYRSAGTVEYLYDPVRAEFYFLEMNTRIQVEHPVTEMVTGIDLVREMIRIAGGEPLRIRQDEVRVSGHSIEVRINAEDPRQNFRPAPGKITGWLPPGGPGVRVDSHVYTGYEIPPFYDSLIGKVIVWGTDRDHALKRLRRALSECAVTGIPTTIEFHLQLLDRPEFQRGDVHTKFVEQEMLPPGK